MVSVDPAVLQKLVILDGGCSQHIFHERKYFRGELKPYTLTSIGQGLSQVTYTGGIGTAYVICKVNGKPYEFAFKNAVYSLNNGVNLVSELQLMDLDAKLSILKEAKGLIFGQTGFVASR